MKVIILIMVHTAFTTFAQRQKAELRMTVFNNAIAMPFSGKLGIFHSPVHPGFSSAYSYRINRGELNRVTLDAQFAYLYQHRVQHAIHLLPQIGYLRRFNFGLGIFAKLGTGYMHSFTDLQQFSRNEDGRYVRVGSWGRAAFLGSFTFGLGFDASELGLEATPFVAYQIWTQSPFIKSYVPILPNAALHVGTAIGLKRKR